MNTGEGHLRKNLVPFLHQFLNYALIVPKGLVDHINVFCKSSMTLLLLAQRASECEIFVEYSRNRIFVMVVPEDFIKVSDLIFMHIHLFKT